MKDYGHNSATQKVTPQTKTLVTISNSPNVKAVVTFRVPVPDSRLRVKISTIFVPQAGQSTVNAGTASLWLYEAEDDMSGTTGTTVPSTNVEGTSAAPTAIPATAGLSGYSREFVTGADAIEGVFTAIAGAAGGLGTWVLQVRYQPESVRFTDAEWNEISQRMNPQLLSSPASV